MFLLGDFLGNVFWGLACIGAVGWLLLVLHFLGVMRLPQMRRGLRKGP